MKYVCKRILMLLVTMVIVSFLAFAAFDLISGSPAEIMLGTQATPDRVAELEAQLGLDRDSVSVEVLERASSPETWGPPTATASRCGS